jgi:hypothetical protein
LQEVASAGIEAILAGPANALADVHDFQRHRRLLDVGGGTGSWSIAAARRHTGLGATVLELPVVAELAAKRIAEVGLADRIDVKAGDVVKDALPVDYDAPAEGSARCVDGRAMGLASLEIPLEVSKLVSTRLARYSSAA